MEKLYQFLWQVLKKKHLTTDKRNTNDEIHSGLWPWSMVINSHIFKHFLRNTLFKSHVLVLLFPNFYHIAGWLRSDAVKATVKDRSNWNCWLKRQAPYRNFLPLQWLWQKSFESASRDLEWWIAATVSEKSWKFSFVLFAEILPKKAWNLWLVKCDSRMTSGSWGPCGCYASVYASVSCEYCQVLCLISQNKSATFVSMFVIIYTLQGHFLFFEAS